MKSLAPKKESRADGVAAVERALSILEAFNGENKPLTLAELASRTGLYKSTILRLAASLSRFSYIERDAAGRYRIGPGAWRIGRSFIHDLQLEQRLQPLLEEIATKTTESAAFYKAITNPPPAARICMLRVDSTHLLREHVRIGDRLPLDLGAAGRVIRAFMRPFNPADEQVRRAGVCTSWGERDPGVCGVAAPVFGPDDEIVGSINLSAPISRRNRAWLKEHTPLVKEMGARATKALGSRG